jgi:hypothetical protein
MSHRARAREAFNVRLARQRNNSFPPRWLYYLARRRFFPRTTTAPYDDLFPVQSCRVVVRAFIVDEIVTTSGCGRRLRNMAERLARRLSFAVYVVYYSCRRQFFNRRAATKSVSLPYPDAAIPPARKTFALEAASSRASRGLPSSGERV